MREIRFEIDGESVAGKLHEPIHRARGQLVLVHGLLSHAAEFAEAANRLASRGWRVFAVDQRGFGASGGARGIITQERATADVLGAVAWLRKDQPDVPIGVVGHSMGAVFALNALAHDPDIRAAVLAAPMHTVRAELGDLEFFRYRVANVISVAKTGVGLGGLLVPYKNRYRDLFHDKAAMKRAEKAGFLSTQVNLQNYHSFLAMDAARTARSVRQPTLVILADFDRAVKRANSMAVYEALHGPKELVGLPCGHSMFGDLEAEAAVAHVDRWMGAHLEARA